MRIDQSVFVVTGGGSGLGAACVRRLVEQGGRVVAVDVDQAAVERVVAPLGDRARATVADVTDEATVRQAVRDAVDWFGPLRGVVQCAGVLGAARLVGRDGPHDLHLFEHVVRINLIGTFNVMRLAAAAMADGPPLEDGERGVIINTSSVAALEGQIGQVAYAASKGGVASMTLPAARELAALGIRVVAIAPGVFATPMVESMPEKVVQSLEAQTVFPKRLGQPEEFAALVQHVIENPMLNGCLLRLDGAVRLAAR